MFNRRTITLSLLFSLALASGVCLGFNVRGDLLSGQTIPIVPEDEEVKSPGVTEFEESRLCDLHWLAVNIASCQFPWHQLTLEATFLPESVKLQAAYPRGPPTF